MSDLQTIHTFNILTKIIGTWQQNASCYIMILNERSRNEWMGNFNCCWNTLHDY